LRTQFVLGQFPVVVFVERLQGRYGVGEFRGVDHTVMVDIQSFHDGWGGAMTTGTTLTARSVMARRAASAVTVRRATGRTTFGRTASGTTVRRAARRSIGRGSGAEFVLGQLPVVVFVQGLQGCDGVGEFGGVDDAVMVGIESGDDGGRGAVMTTGSASTRRRAVLGRGILGAEIETGGAERGQNQQGEFLIHTIRVC